MFGFALNKKRNTAVSDASIRYETAVKEKQVYSLSFEAAQHLEQASNNGFLAAVNEACRNIGRELMLMRQVQLLDQAILAPRKFGSVWLPVIVEKPSPHNLLVTLDKIIGEGYVQDFVALLKRLLNQPGVYELVPGLALFGNNGKLHVTASKALIANLNNE